MRMDKLDARIYDDGSTYLGEMKDGNKHGTGRYVHTNGDVYYSEWKDGKKHGRGRYVSAAGDNYFGEWKDDLKHGQGEYTYANGDVYDGEWKDDLKHGQGRYTYANGDLYDGEWKYDKKDGQGTYTYKYGREEYVGEWKDDLKHGKGTSINRTLYEYSDVYDKYDGEWKYGKKDGQGTLSIANGDVYNGEWKNGTKHGHGRYTYANGDSYDGEWEDSMKHGQGKYISADGSALTGEWINNEYKIDELDKVDSSNYQEVPKDDNKYYEEEVKGKSPILATILGLFLGPIGMLYFGWRTFASILLTVVIATLLNSFYFEYDIPGWTYLNMLYFGIWGFVLASFYDERVASFGLGPLLMCRYYLWLNIVALFLISIIQDLREGYYFSAALEFFIFMPLTIYLFTMAISYVVTFILSSGKTGNTH